MKTFGDLLQILKDNPLLHLIKDSDIDAIIGRINFAKIIHYPDGAIRLITIEEKYTMIGSSFYSGHCRGWATVVERSEDGKEVWLENCNP